MYNKLVQIIRMSKHKAYSKLFLFSACLILHAFFKDNSLKIFIFLSFFENRRTNLYATCYVLCYVCYLCRDVKCLLNVFASSKFLSTAHRWEKDTFSKYEIVVNFLFFHQVKYTFCSFVFHLLENQSVDYSAP